MPERVRLVIWDLDETFWKGTLTEGGIREYVQANHDIVVALAERGIMSSICSKNDIGPVRDILVERGIWDYFIFPSIDWSGKGRRVGAIIEAVQLRPETVLFIDDNHGNRAEASAAVPGLQTADETIIPDLLESPLLSGKDDRSLSRLKQYKLLEQRAAEQSAYEGDNSEFLRESAIMVTVDHDVLNNIDRAIELINRTNQLNFTKSRLPDDLSAARAKLREQLGRFDARAGLVSVRDRFGDYGVCGFFLMYGHKSRNRLAHFCFSCRVLGMGVEQWLYQRLGKPSLLIVGEVVSELGSDPDWINIDGVLSTGVKTETSLHTVRIRGGCELEVIEHFFRLDAASVSSEVATQKGLLPLLRNHSGLLHESFKAQSPQKSEEMACLGIDADEVVSRFFDPCEDGTLLVYSNTLDASAGLFQHKSLDLCLPIQFPGLAHPSLMSSSVFDSHIKQRGLNDAESRWLYTIRDHLTERFELVSKDYEARFRSIYEDIAVNVPKNAHLIWVLPNYVRWGTKGERVENARQKRLNDLAREATASFPHISTLDMFSLIREDRDIKEWFHHFDRSVYFRLYKKLAEMHDQWLLSTKASAWADWSPVAISSSR